MTLIYAAGVAGLGVSAALGHSWLGEHKVFRPLYTEPQTGMLRSAPVRDVIRIVWHLPSIAWAVLGLSVLGSRLGTGSTILSLAAAIIFAASGIGNFIALRRTHFGGVILLAVSGLTLLDWQIHISV